MPSAIRVVSVVGVVCAVGVAVTNLYLSQVTFSTLMWLAWSAIP